MSNQVPTPAGYRPVRESEMDQLPQADDAFWSNDMLYACGFEYRNSFRCHVVKGRGPWFRPLTKPDPDTKEDRNWISWYLEAVEDGDAIEHYADDLTEQEAMEDAELTAKEGHICFVAKIVGKFVPLGSKWIPND